MPFVRCRDIEIYYEAKGEGPRLLYIGGTGGDLKVKPNVFDGALAKQFEVLSFDQRGLGQSGKPDRPYTMAEYADDAAALMDAVGWANACVMGVSFGGMVALHMIARHPDKVSKLVLACTSSGGQGGSSYPLHKLADMPRAEAAAIRVGVVDTRRDKAWQAANQEVLQAEGEAMALARKHIPATDESRMGMRRQVEARAEHDAYNALADIAVPILIAAGRYDGQAPPENQEAMLAAIPGASLSFFEGGHGFLRQDQEAMESVIAFLSRD